MSTTTTPNDSPAPIQPLHNPKQAAHVVVPQAPLGNATNGQLAPGMGAKALLAKRMAKNNPTYVSPTDNMLTPCSQKIGAAKKKHFNKGAKPMPSLFAKKDTSSESDEESPKDEKMNDDENPF
ncbi:hypothetical protein QCA50_000681 [Cerrena zonata]|uniref:Uncharacterized protein n=1 Tax=Cerrena zonata TaxID=2478898 RepID=A0AAW0H003_9APHY